MTDLVIGDPLVRAVDQKRRDLGLNNAAFATFLTERGVSTTPQRWSKMVRNKRGYRRAWEKGVCRIWPDLTGHIIADRLAPAPEAVA